MRAGRVAAVGAGLILLGQLAGCSQETPRAAAAAGGSPIELTRNGACGEAFFWAATASGDTAVSVAVDLVHRPDGEPTTVRFDLPDPAVDVTVLDGEDVPRNFCTDLPDPSAEPTGTHAASAGEGVATVGPPAAMSTVCGGVAGTLSLDGLVADDGREFAPIRFSSDTIGCYAG
jgi:hypothetical protein